MTLARVAACLAVMVAVLPGCGGSTAATSGNDAGVGGGLDGANEEGTGSDGWGGAQVHPPPPASPGHAGAGADMVYAADHFVLGDVDFDGTPDPSAWKSLGFDLDNADTSDPANQPNCLLFGAPPQDRTQLLDGQGGIDNTFGALLFQGWNASAQQTSLATSGQWTLLIRVMGNDGSDGQVGVPGAVYVGAPLSAPPRFDGTDAWPPTTDSDPGGSPLAEWGAGYMVGSSFYVTEPMSIAFDMAGASGRRARLPIRAMVVQLQFSTDLSHITRGVLSGILSNSDFDTSMSTCLGAPADAMSYTDILTDRAVDPSRRCDGVSIAIGFTATQVTLAAPRSGLASPNQCGDGG